MAPGPGEREIAAGAAQAGASWPLLALRLPARLPACLPAQTVSAALCLPACLLKSFPLPSACLLQPAQGEAHQGFRPHEAAEPESAAAALAGEAGLHCACARLGALLHHKRSALPTPPHPPSFSPPQVADRIRKHMVDRVPRILPVEMEKNVKGFVDNVESLVDKVVSGERPLHMSAVPGHAACRRGGAGAGSGHGQAPPHPTLPHPPIPPHPVPPQHLLPLLTSPFALRTCLQARRGWSWW